jgi:hypothetical protein
MIKKLGILLLIAAGANAQDKGQFESYSNPFYGTIVNKSNTYDKAEKEENKSCRKSNLAREHRYLLVFFNYLIL